MAEAGETPAVVEGCSVGGALAAGDHGHAPAVETFRMVPQVPERVCHVADPQYPVSDRFLGPFPCRVSPGLRAGPRSESDAALQEWARCIPGAGHLAPPPLDYGRRLTAEVVKVARAEIAADKAPFISRGDRSGTHAAELRYWKDAGVDIDQAKGPWYREIGQGMGAALNTAAASDGYVLSDRGTWLSFKNKRGLAIAVQGDKRLFNQYGVMLVNPQKHPTVKKELGQQFIDWLISADGQAAIAAYKINGEQLFYPNAHDAGA